MSRQRDADRATGIELQIEEIVEQRQRAVVQGQTADVERFDAALAALYDDLANVAEHTGE